MTFRRSGKPPAQQTMKALTAVNTGLDFMGINGDKGKKDYIEL